MQTMPPTELARWCQRTLPQDQRAFEQLVRQYSGHVFALTYRLIGHPQDAEDLAQEVFVKVHRTIKDLDEPASLTAWITRITVNTCREALRDQRRRPPTIPLWAEAQHARDAEPPAYVDRHNPTPEAAALDRELQDCLQVTLAQLDPDGRTVLILRDVQGHSYQEIAEMLTLGLSAVKMRIHRTRLTFQELFQRLCPDLWHTQAARTAPTALAPTGQS